MSTLTDRERQALAAVEDALRTYPLAAPPRSLTPAATARLRTVALVPRFRLEWIDLAISLFGAIMTGLVFLLWQSTTPEMAARLQIQFLILQQQFSLLAFAPLLLGSATTALLASLAASLYVLPRWRG